MERIGTERKLEKNGKDSKGAERTGRERIGEAKNGKYEGMDLTGAEVKRQERTANNKGRDRTRSDETGEDRRGTEGIGGSMATKKRNEETIVKADILSIPVVLRQYAQLWIVGETPLIVHRMGQCVIDKMKGEQEGITSGPREHRDPTAEFEDAKYCFAKDGKVAHGIKAIGFKRGMEAWSKDTINKSKKLVRGGVDFFGEAGEFAILKFSECVMRTDRVKIGKGLTTLTYRPQYNDWSTLLLMEWDPSIFTPQQLVTLLQRVGTVNGLGELRPQQCGDTFGKYRITKFKQIEREDFPIKEEAA